MAQASSREITSSLLPFFFYSSYFFLKARYKRDGAKSIGLGLAI